MSTTTNESRNENRINRLPDISKATAPGRKAESGKQKGKEGKNELD
jgi:hypothetical protein